MFDISTINKRYFEIKLILTDENDEVKCIELEVGAPKIKVLKRLLALKKADNEEAMDELTDVITALLSKNKTNRKVPREYVAELDQDEMKELLTAYFDWLGKEKNSKN